MISRAAFFCLYQSSLLEFFNHSLYSHSCNVFFGHLATLKESLGNNNHKVTHRVSTESQYKHLGLFKVSIV